MDQSSAHAKYVSNRPRMRDNPRDITDVELAKRIRYGNDDAKAERLRRMRMGDSELENLEKERRLEMAMAAAQAEHDENRREFEELKAHLNANK